MMNTTCTDPLPRRRLAPHASASRQPWRAAFALALSLASPLVFAQARLAGIHFLPAVQSVGENGRVLLVNFRGTGGRVNLPPDPCRASVQFLDVNGDGIGAAQQITLAPGQSAGIEAPVFTRAGVPSLVRANVTVLSRPAAPPDPCAGLHGHYEVYDTQSLETKFVSPGAIRGFNPQPDPPGVATN